MTKNEQMEYAEETKKIMELNLYKLNLAITDCDNNGLTNGYLAMVDEVYKNLSVIPTRLNLLSNMIQADMRAERKSEVANYES